MVYILAKDPLIAISQEPWTSGSPLFPEPDGRYRERPRSRASDPVISGCYHRINAETLMKRAVSAKAVSAPKAWCGCTT